MSEATGTQPALSIIIPAYNERQRLPTSLLTIRDYVRSADLDVELLVVDDGSIDGTADAAEAFDPAPMRYRVIRCEVNRGKGAAVRRGMLEATGKRRLFSDADLSTPMNELPKLLAHAEQGFDVVIGSRDLPESVLNPPQPWARRMGSTLFRMFRRLLLLPSVRDTQCGFKLFSQEAAEAIFTQLQTEGFAFDLEVLGLAEHLGYRIVEVPIYWSNDQDSRVRVFRDGWRSTCAIWTIRQRLRKMQYP